jgi:hypothetical protein
MKRREVVPEGCAGERYVLKRSAEEERSSKRCDFESKVSREDIEKSSS